MSRATQTKELDMVNGPLARKIIDLLHTAHVLKPFTGIF